MCHSDQDERNEVTRNEMHSPSLKVKPEDSHGQQTVPILTRIKMEVIEHEKILNACRMFEYFLSSAYKYGRFLRTEIIKS